MKTCHAQSSTSGAGDQSCGYVRRWSGGLPAVGDARRGAVDVLVEGGVSQRDRLEV